MSSLTPFQFGERPIRVVTDHNGEPLFVGKDVCEVLGYVNTADAIGTHCRGVAKRYPIADALGRMQETRVLAEPDVLRLIVNCSLPAAEAFERWVFEEVLPTIRRTGSYSSRTADPAPSSFQLAQALDMATSVADRICNRFPKLGEEAQQVIFAKIVNPIAGDDVIPLPRLESKTYTATEVGQLLGISANKVGRLSKTHNLKASEFGVFVLDKSASSVKQVESFRYNEAGANRLREIIQLSAGDPLGGAQ